MSKYTWLLRAGHGGMFNGVYQTEGKRSPKWGDGSQLFEGEYNRAIASRLMERMTEYNLRYIQIHHPYKDIPLSEQIAEINKLNSEYENCILLDFHANAGGGSGFEVFTSPGETLSDKIATVFMENVKDIIPNLKVRADYSDGDPDKEELFSVLIKTHCPSILLESAFMDNEYECKYILSWGRDLVADAYFSAIMEIERNGI